MTIEKKRPIRDYHECPRLDIGGSDMARLVLVGFDHASLLNYGEDGKYFAYFVNRFREDEVDVRIPSHYHQVDCFQDSLWIYDDDGIRLTIGPELDPTIPWHKTITVYRAGERGCLIEVTK